MEKELDVRRVRRELDMTQDEFAEAIGVNRVTVLNWEKGKTSIPEYRAQSILDLYKSKGADIPHLDESSDTMRLPLIPVDAMAGALSGTGDAIMEYDCEKYIIPIFSGAEFLIRVQGDSMMPKYMPGDIVACRRVTLDKLWFQWGKTYVLDTRQGALIKRIEKSGEDGCVMIHSENSQYQPFSLPVEELLGLAIVVGVIRVE